MRCWNCGNTLYHDMQFCEWCGAELEKTQSYAPSSFISAFDNDPNYPQKSNERIGFQNKPIYKQTAMKKVHKNSKRKPKYDMLLLLTIIASIIYLIFIILLNGNMFSNGFTNNDMLSHCIAILLSSIISSIGMYYKQEGFILTGAILLTIASLFYLPTLPIIMILASFNYFSYFIQYHKNRYNYKKKSA